MSESDVLQGQEPVGEASLTCSHCKASITLCHVYYTLCLIKGSPCVALWANGSSIAPWSRLAGPAPRVISHPTPPLLALQAGKRLRKRIELVLRLGDSSRVIGPVVFASNWQALADLGEQHPGSPAVVDPEFEDIHDSASAEANRVCLQDRSSTPLIQDIGRSFAEKALGDTRIRFAARVRAGVEDDIGSLDAAILRSIDIQREHLLLEHVRKSADPFAERVLRHALRLAIGPTTVPEIASSLGHPRRTLQRHCAVLGIPGPGNVIGLARLFTVERLSQWSRQPSGAVALALGFSHPANYRRLARRLVGVPPSVVGKRGGADYVQEAVVRALSP